MTVRLFGRFHVGMVLDHRQRERRHDGGMFVHAGRQLFTVQLLQAASRQLGLPGIVAPGCDTRQDCATGVTTGVIAERALPAVVMPGHADGEVLNRSLPRLFDHMA